MNLCPTCRRHVPDEYEGDTCPWCERDEELNPLNEVEDEQHGTME